MSTVFISRRHADRLQAWNYFPDLLLFVFTKPSTAAAPDNDTQQYKSTYSTKSSSQANYHLIREVGPGLCLKQKYYIDRALWQNAN